MRVSKAEFARIKAAARKARRAEKARDNALLDAYASSQEADGTIRIPPPPKRKRRKPSARRAAFNALKAACKAYVFARNLAKNAGLCEIAMACGGSEQADTWYHGWPQKGGNGLKYEVASHFASCSRCNMGEYGERMRGGKRYEDRHKTILGPLLWAVLDNRHGRKAISTVEARELTADILSRIERKDWGRSLIVEVAGTIPDPQHQEAS